MEEEKLSILIAEDEEAVRQIEIAILQKRYHVVAVDSLPAVLEACALKTFNLILLDNMPSPVVDELTLVKKLRILQPAAKIVICSGWEIKQMERAYNGLPDGYIHKPFTSKQLIEAISKFLLEQ